MEHLLLRQSQLGDVDDSACAGNHSVGVRVFGLAPGVVDTDMQVTIRASGINRVSQIPRA
jgi:NAD(P)-dependent dehydrogenase (short-subunit alcohol dehydrogenase family)